MTTKRRLPLICCLLLLLLATVSACKNAFDNSHSKDAELISNFEQHEQEFNTLIQMAKEDSHVVRIAYDFTWLDTDYHWPRPSSEIGFSEGRWDQYKRIFSKLGLRKGLAWTSDGAIILISSTRGMMTDGSAKGYTFSTKPLSPTFDSLDHISEEIRSGKVSPGLPVYRKIKENWYLYYEGD
jgi:ABC-type oligopeptide transport system substrate-binding subunit